MGNAGRQFALPLGHTVGILACRCAGVALRVLCVDSAPAGVLAARSTQKSWSCNAACFSHAEGNTEQRQQQQRMGAYTDPTCHTQLIQALQYRALLHLNGPLEPRLHFTRNSQGSLHDCQTGTA